MAYEDNLIKFIDSYKQVLDGKKNGEDEMVKQFAALKLQAGKFKQEEPSKAGEKACNIKKNRYKDILPFDTTRFVLKSTDSSPEGYDYINASFIQGSKEKHAYIAAQGPLQTTVNDFWRLLWESGANIIVMACNEYEMGKNKQRQLKCQRYWCEDEDEQKQFGEISVTLIDSEIQHRDYKHRHLKAKKGSIEKTFHQFHYVSWPDHGVPDTVTSILELIQRVRKLQPDEKKPVIVHCSAGCGRTGTILALDYVSELIKEKDIPSDFSLFDIIMNMRKQRPAIVQTKDQYEFVHKAVSELFKHELSSLGLDYGHNYENVQIGVLPAAAEKPRMPPGLPSAKPSKPQNGKATTVVTGKPATPKPTAPVSSTKPSIQVATARSSAPGATGKPPTPSGRSTTPIFPTGKPLTPVATGRPPPPTAAGRAPTPVSIGRPLTPVKPEPFIYANAGDADQSKPLKPPVASAVKPRTSSSRDIREMEDVERTLAEKKPDQPRMALKPSKQPLMRRPSGGKKESGVSSALSKPKPSKLSPPASRKPLMPSIDSKTLANIKGALNTDHLATRSPGVGSSRPAFQPPKPPNKSPSSDESAYEAISYPAKTETKKSGSRGSRPTSLESHNTWESPEKGSSIPSSNVGVVRRLPSAHEYEITEPVCPGHQRKSDPVLSTKPSGDNKATHQVALKPHSTTTPPVDSAYEDVPAKPPPGGTNRHSTGLPLRPSNPSPRKISAPPRAAQSHDDDDDDGAPVVPVRTAASYELVDLTPPGGGDGRGAARFPARPPHNSAISKAANGGRSIPSRRTNHRLDDDDDEDIPVVPERTSASYELVTLQPPAEDATSKSSGSSSHKSSGGTFSNFGKKIRGPLSQAIFSGNATPKPPPETTSSSAQRSDTAMANGQPKGPLAFPHRIAKPVGPRPQPAHMSGKAQIRMIPS